MNKISVPVLLLLQLVLIDVIVTSAEDSVQVVSFRKLRRMQNGPVMCALDAANKTISTSSLEHCSLDCTRDATCDSFNLKDSHTCDLYNYRAKVIAPVSQCENYQVSCSLVSSMYSSRFALVVRLGTHYRVHGPYSQAPFHSIREQGPSTRPVNTGSVYGAYKRVADVMKITLRRPLLVGLDRDIVGPCGALMTADNYFTTHSCSRINVFDKVYWCTFVTV